MDEYEEVVLEGGALYNHLKENCQHDFECVPRKTVSRNEIVKSQKENDNTVISVQKISCRRLREKLFYIIKNIISPYELGVDNLKLTSLKLIQNGTLEEDRTILEYMSSWHAILLNQNAQEKEKMKSDLIAKYRITLGNVYGQLWHIGIISIILIPLLLFQNGFIGVCIVLFLIAAKLALRLFNIWQFNQGQRNIDAFVELSHNLFKMCSKSQRILNEIDLISKETNVSFHISIGNALYTAQEVVTDEFMSFLTCCHSLLKEIATKSENDSISAFFDDRFTDGPNLVKVSNSTSLSKLKVKRDIIIQQYSGFLTELILLMECWSRHYNRWYCRSFSLFDHWQISRLKEKVARLEQCIKLANQIWFGNDAQKPVACEKKSEKLADIVRVSNSLSTRSKSFLTNFYSFEALLTRSCDSSAEELTTGFLELESFCDQMATELESCSGCLEEINAILRFKTEPTAPAISPLVEPARIVARQNPIVGDVDPTPVDEVFEAYVSLCKTVQPHQDASNVDEQDESECMRAQKMHCRNVLKEMQPILRQRRTIWEKREEVALRRDKNADHVESTENLGPCDTVTIVKEKCISSHPTNTTTDAVAKETVHEVMDDGVDDNIEAKTPLSLQERIATWPSDSDGPLMDRNSQSLEERIASWDGNVGLGLMSVLKGFPYIRPMSDEQTLVAIGEASSECDIEPVQSTSQTTNLDESIDLYLS